MLQKRSRFSQIGRQEGLALVYEDRDTAMRILFLPVPAKRCGQAVIEYAGAVIVSAVIIATLAAATRTNSWMYNAYNNLYNSAGTLLINTLTHGLN